MGCGSSSEPSRVQAYLSVPPEVRVYRRDGADTALVQELIRREHAKGGTHEALSAFRAGAWKAFVAANELALAESVPENQRAGVDPDHWYEINTANAALFRGFTLEGCPELLPGRLFSTRMPRNVASDAAAAAAFGDRVKRFALHTVLILTEKKEYEKYAGADLEAFYRGLKLNIINRPIKDFCVPNNEEMAANIKDVTRLLSEGRSVLVHCAGGSGRTGMVIAGVVRNVGVTAPLVWVRAVRSAYVETEAQAAFIDSLPLVIDAAVCKKAPMLAKVIAAKHLLMKANTMVHHAPGEQPEEAEEAEASERTIADLGAVFDLIDADHSGAVSAVEVKSLFEGLGSLAAFDKVLPRLDKNGDGAVSKQEFIKILTE